MLWRWFSRLAALGLISSSALAQSSPPHLTATERTEALQAIEANFQEQYVFPEMRPKIIDRLRLAQQAGLYEVDDPALFAERITQDLRDVAHDEHLSLSVDPAAYAAALAPPQSDAGEDAFRSRRSNRNHHGLTEMRIFPGNLRYLKIVHFEWVQDETGAIYDDAMRFLKGGDAWILDLRGNGGGTSAASHYLISHFLDPGTLDFTSYAGSKTPSPSLALDYLPAGRLRGKPLYVLIDAGVGSAAEAVAYDIQQFKLGELVGAKTAGAANNNKLLPIAPSFILSLSYGRPVHAISNTNWEGIGVQPSVECAPAQALDVAQSLALRRLARTPGVAPEIRAEYAWSLTQMEARLHPVAVSPAQLRALAGRYGKPDVGFGKIDVEFQDGFLWLDRSNRPRARLSPLTADGIFAIEGSDLLRARLTGKSLELLWWDDPHPRLFMRQ